MRKVARDEEAFRIMIEPCGRLTGATPSSNGLRKSVEYNSMGQCSSLYPTSCEYYGPVRAESMEPLEEGATRAKKPE